MFEHYLVLVSVSLLVLGYLSMAATKSPRSSRWLTIIASTLLAAYLIASPLWFVGGAQPEWATQSGEVLLTFEHNGEHFQVIEVGEQVRLVKLDK